CCMCLLTLVSIACILIFFFFQAEDGIRDFHVTGVQTCALPILRHLLMEKKAPPPPDPGETEQEQKTLTYSLAFPDLLKLSLTANHLEAFFILLALLINVFDELRQILGGNDYMDTYGRNLMGQTVLFMSSLVVAVIVLSMLFSIVRTMVKYYGFRLMDADGRWIISY